VPDASTHLFSVKAAAQNGYSTTMNEKVVVIRRGDGTVAASGKYSTTSCRGPPGNPSGNIASKAEHYGHQNRCHVMKVLKQHGINVEANKEFCDSCALGKAHRQSFGTRTT